MATTKRLGPNDFGYTFVGYQPPKKEEDPLHGEDEAPEGRKDEAAAPEDAVQVNDEEEPFVYKPPRRRGHPSYDDVEDGGAHGGGDGACFAVSGFGACCCCMTAVLCVAGGILIAYDRAYAGDGEKQYAFAGTVLLVLGAASCVCGCCALCVGCTAAVAGGGPFGPGDSGGGSSSSDPKEVRVRFRRLNGRLENAEDALDGVRLDVLRGLKEVKQAQKKEAKEKKEEEAKQREELERRVHDDLEAGRSVREIRQTYRPVVFYISFYGDSAVSNMELLRKQVSLIVNLGRAGVDQAVVVVTSPGGEVSQYGLAASQLIRIRKAGIKLVVCVDSIAASGGYMMASVADMIFAAPFAIVGSIGVLAQIPNFQRFLEKHSIDAYVFTSGKYKRTVDVIGDVTEEGKAKLNEELEEMHRVFKDHIALARPRLQETIEAIATGEHWLAVQAKEKGLVDEIMTSDEYLDSLRERFDIIEILEKKHRSMWSDALDLRASVARGVKSVAEGLRLSTGTSQRQGYTPMAIS